MTLIDPEIRKKLTRARAAMLIDQPFFGSLALRLNLKVMPQHMTEWFLNQSLRPTLAVDGKNIWYHEPFIQNLDSELVKSAVAHEVGHCVFDHTSRRNGRDPRAWNVAGDYVINDMLKDAGFRLGEGWLYDPKYKGWSTDQIYASFPPGKGPGPGQNPQDNVLDGEPGDQVQLENDWKIATIQAANAAKAEGKLPGSLQRFVDDITAPKNDWKERLRHFITEKAKDDYNWLRPNRRYLSAGIFLPSLYSETMECLVVVTDDSGSIGSDILSCFSAETAAARDASRPKKTIIISCDARVNHVEELEPDDEFRVENHGGGGTDFRPPFEWLKKRGIRPSCLVYLTDMYGTFPDEPPEYPVLWCSINNVEAPWGETIHIEV